MAKVGTIPREKILLEVKHDGDVLNTGGTGGNGTATNVTYQSTDRGYQVQDSIYGATSQTTFGTAINSVMAVHMRIYPTANTKTILSFSTGVTIDIKVDNTISFVGVTGEVAYVNNVLNGACTLNAWNDVIVNFPSTNATSFNIGVLSYTGKIGAVRLLNANLNVQEIQSLYMEGLRKLGGGGLAPLSDGLVAYYDMNGDAQDIVGGNNGTVTGATLTTDRFGNSNKAYSFNGSTTKIALTPYSSGGTAVTISAWVKYTSTGNGAIIHGSLSTGNPFWFIGSSNATDGKPRAIFRGTASASVSNPISTVAYNDGNWHQFLATWNGTTGVAKLYVDGVLNSTGGAGATGDIFSSNNSMNIGYDQHDNLWFTGDIGDTRIVQRILSDSEILALYQLESKEYITKYL